MIDLNDLKIFSKLGALSPKALRMAAEAMTHHVFMPGEILFRKGDDDRLTYFLLEGSVALTSSPESPVVFIYEDTDAAQYPLSPQKPHCCTARAMSITVVLSIDDHLLDKLLTHDQLAYEVTAIENEDPEWVFSLFTNPDIQKIPSAHLPALFGKLRPMQVKAGQIIFRRGDPADYYYLIRRGRAWVSRSSEPGGTSATVAEIGVGEGFGGASLLSGERHGSTITMLTDGLLMLLSPSDFNALIRPPMVHRVGAEEVMDMVRNGAILIDVRTDKEYLGGALPGSIHVPLSNLRIFAQKLDRNRPYITVCKTGSRSSAAAFLLNHLGFNAYVLRGGMNSIMKPYYPSSCIHSVP